MTKQHVDGTVYKLKPMLFWEAYNNMDFDKFSYLLNFN